MGWRHELAKRIPHHEHVKAQVVRDEFHRIVGPELKKLGFERAREDTWLRSISDDINHVIQMKFLKGDSHQILLGGGLTFTPCISQRSVRRHTPSEPSWEMLDLVHDPYSEDDYNPIQQNISASSGLKFLRKDIKLQKKRLIPYLKSYFSKADTLEGVLAMYELERNRDHKGLGFQNYARHMIAYPFLLARLGQYDRAVPLIQERLNHLEATETVREKTMEKLRKVADLHGEKHRSDTCSDR